MQSQPQSPATEPVAAPTPAIVAPLVSTTPQGTVPVVLVQTPETDAGVKDFLEFGQAFAWPLTIVVLAALFHKQIAAKIENMTSLTTPVAESTWEARAEAVADLAESIVNTAGTAPPEPVERPDPAPTQGGEGDPVVEAESPPRRYEAVMPDTSNTEAIGAVILLWNAVEQSVRDLASSRSVEARNFLPAYRWLTRTGVIPPTTVELIDQLRKLRNDVVHLKGAEVDPEAYRRTVLAVLDSLEQARRRPPPPPPPPPPRSIAGM